MSTLPFILKAAGGLTVKLSFLIDPPPPPPNFRRRCHWSFHVSPSCPSLHRPIIPHFLATPLLLNPNLSYVRLLVSVRGYHDYLLPRPFIGILQVLPGSQVLKKRPKSFNKVTLSCFYQPSSASWLGTFIYTHDFVREHLGRMNRCSLRTYMAAFIFTTSSWRYSSDGFEIDGDGTGSHCHAISSQYSLYLVGVVVLENYHLLERDGNTIQVHSPHNENQPM